MIAFIEDHKVALGVEPICRALSIPPSTFYVHAAMARDPGLESNRAKPTGNIWINPTPAAGNGYLYSAAMLEVLDVTPSLSKTVVRPTHKVRSSSFS